MDAARGSQAVRPSVCVLAFAALQTGAAAQAPPIFRGGVDLVQIDASVTRGGAPVGGLTAGDFTVFDNGVQQETQSATLDEVPLDVQLVLDVSESVTGERLDHLVAAGTGLLRSLRSGDRIGLLTFSNVLQVRAAMTVDRTSVGRLLAGIVPSGQTALRDAVRVGLTIERRAERRPLLIVFTDGVDNSSWLSEEDLLESARRAGIVIHIVRVGGRESTASKFLEQLTSVTGGRAWSASSARDMDSLFTKALDEMRARYVLAFSLRGSARPGWHEVTVKLKDGRGDVVARPGYFVNPSP